MRVLSSSPSSWTCPFIQPKRKGYWRRGAKYLSCEMWPLPSPTSTPTTRPPSSTETSAVPMSSWKPSVMSDNGRPSCQTLDQPTSATLPAPLLRSPLCTLLLRSVQRTGADRRPRSTCTALGCWCVRCVCVDSLQRGTSSPSMLSEVRRTAPNLFRDCTSHAHQDRPTMRNVLWSIDELIATAVVQVDLMFLLQLHNTCDK